MGTLFTSNFQYMRIPMKKGMAHPVYEIPTHVIIWPEIALWPFLLMMAPIIRLLTVPPSVPKSTNRATARPSEWEGRRYENWETMGPTHDSEKKTPNAYIAIERLKLWENEKQISMKGNEIRGQRKQISPLMNGYLCSSLSAIKLPM